MDFEEMLEQMKIAVQARFEVAIQQCDLNSALILLGAADALRGDDLKDVEYWLEAWEAEPPTADTLGN